MIENIFIAICLMGILSIVAAIGGVMMMIVLSLNYYFTPRPDRMTLSKFISLLRAVWRRSR